MNKAMEIILSSRESYIKWLMTCFSYPREYAEHLADMMQLEKEDK